MSTSQSCNQFYMVISQRVRGDGKMRLNNICLMSVFAFLTLASPVSALPVNETIGDYRISFDAEDNTLGAIGKLWNNSGENLFELNQLPNSSPIRDLALKEAYFAGMFLPKVDDEDDDGKDNDQWALAVVVVLEKPINISGIEEIYITNSSKKYIRVYDRIIDSHKGVLIQSGNSSNDPLMDYLAIYFLDENQQSEAAKLVFVITEHWKEGAERFMNTIHVEDLQE
jgi:hypothetical protein